MKTLTFLSIVAVLAMAGHAEAKSVWTEMSMASFKSRCASGGGALAVMRGKGVRCSAPNGQYITCIDTKGFGITCDWRTADRRRPQILSANGDVGAAGPFGGGPAAGGGGNGGPGGDADSESAGEGQSPQ